MTSQWRSVPLAEAAERIFVGIASAATHAYRETGVLLIRNLNITDVGIDLSDRIFIDPNYEKQHARKRLKEGDVVTVRTGFAGISAPVSADLAGAQCFTSLVTRPRRDLLDSRFLAYYLNSPLGEKAFSTSEAGGSQKNVNAGELEKLVVPLPPIREQREIAAVLSVWDTAIEKIEQLIAAKDGWLHHTRDHIFEHVDVAARTKLHTVTRELTNRNGAYLRRDAIMAVTKEVGMRPMREESIASNIERYKVVPPRAFAYNPMRLNIGSIAMSPFDTDVLVSPDYVVFACDESRMLPGYLNHLRHTRHWRSYFGQAGNGSVRVRIYYDDLGAFSFPLPALDVQARVVRFLDAAAQEITLLRKEADALRRQKRGLMQKLLTGEWRLPLRDQEAV